MLFAVKQLLAVTVLKLVNTVSKASVVCLYDVTLQRIN